MVGTALSCHSSWCWESGDEDVRILQRIPFEHWQSKQRSAKRLISTKECLSRRCPRSSLRIRLLPSIKRDSSDSSHLIACDILNQTPVENFLWFFLALERWLLLGLDWALHPEIRLWKKNPDFANTSCWTKFTRKYFPWGPFFPRLWMAQAIPFLSALGSGHPRCVWIEFGIRPANIPQGHWKPENTGSPSTGQFGERAMPSGRGGFDTKNSSISLTNLADIFKRRCVWCFWKCFFQWVSSPPFGPKRIGGEQCPQTIAPSLSLKKVIPSFSWRYGISMRADSSCGSLNWAQRGSTIDISIKFRQVFE